MEGVNARIGRHHREEPVGGRASQDTSLEWYNLLRIPQDEPGKENPIADMLCPKCKASGSAKAIRFQCSLPYHANDRPPIEIRGIMRCLKDQHEWPFVMSEGFIEELATALPGSYSRALNASVPADRREDIQEAERANWAQCYRAAAVMCRRAVQLGLVEKGIADTKLSSMIEDAVKKKLLLQTAKLAEAVKLFGDIGAHRLPDVKPEEVTMTIYASVEILNELFSP